MTHSITYHNRAEQSTFVMETRKVIVVVEEVEVARTALQWALHNLLRYGDHIILLYVFPSTTTTTTNTSTRSISRSNKKERVLRLKGFQLALSFKDLCDHSVLDAKVEIIVREGDQEGRTIATMIRETGASDLVLGLHDQSFLYRMAMAHGSIRDNLRCRVLAIKQPLMMMPSRDNSTANLDLDFTQIEIARISVPSIPRQKIPYQILPSPFSIIWRSKRRKE